MTLTTIAGRTVFDFMPEFSSTPTILAARQTEMLSVSQAKRVAQFSGKKAVHTLNQQYRFTTREDILSFCAFVETVAGRWNAFWLPSWHAELNPVVSGINTSSPLLRITPVDYLTAYKLTTVDTRLGRYIWALHKSGAVLKSRVASVANIGGVEIITLETAPLVNWTLGDYVAGFLYYVRLASDKITLEFTGANEAVCQLSFIEVINVTDQAAASGGGGGLAGDPKSVDDSPSGTPPSGASEADPFTTPIDEVLTDADGNVLTT